MPQNYTTWPTVQQVKDYLAASGIPIRNNSDTHIQRTIAGVVSDLEVRTHRQFIADTVDSSRKFDGTGTGELVVDDMVSLTSVKILGYTGIAAWDVSTAVLLEENSFAKNKIIIASGVPYQFNYGVFSRFPEGRANIEVTGKFGFDIYIPDDVWLAVCARSATILAGQFITDSKTGRILSSWIEGASSEKYTDGSFKQIGEVQGWIKQWTDTVRIYKKPFAERSKRVKRVMI
jgi:hypothetical protein